MTKPIARDPIYRKRVFDADIIELCVRWYITYRLSYRDLVEMMAERGIAVAHTTVLRWVTRYIPEFEKRWNRFSKAVGTAWRVNETYISIKEKSTCIAPSTSTARMSISCSAAIGASRLRGRSSAKRSRRRFRACHAK
jgi:hypothetical protein